MQHAYLCYYEYNKEMFTHSLEFESRSTSVSCFFESPIILFLRSSSFRNCSAFVFVKDWVKEEMSVMPQYFSLEGHQQKDKETEEER